MKYLSIMILCASVLLGTSISWSQGEIVLDNELSVHGAALRLQEETGVIHHRLEADVNGEGGFFQVEGEPGDYFRVDGNSSGEVVVSVNGNASDFTINSGATGNAAVTMTAGAVNSVEIENEAGVASSLSNTGTTLTTTYASAISRTITCPTAGYVLAIATAQANISHTTGSSSYIEMGVNDVGTTLPLTQDVGYQIPSGSPSGTYTSVSTVHGVFSVTAGVKTFHLVAREGSSTTGSFNDKNLSLIFIPTAYGAVTTNITGGGSSSRAQNSDDQATVVSSLTDDEIQAEKEESIQVYKASVAAELAKMKKEIDAMQAKMDNNDFQVS